MCVSVCVCVCVCVCVSVCQCVKNRGTFRISEKGGGMQVNVNY